MRRRLGIVSIFGVEVGWDDGPADCYTERFGRP